VTMIATSASTDRYREHNKNISRADRKKTWPLRSRQRACAQRSGRVLIANFAAPSPRSEWLESALPRHRRAHRRRSEITISQHLEALARPPDRHHHPPALSHSRQRIRAPRSSTLAYGEFADDYRSDRALPWPVVVGRRWRVVGRRGVISRSRGEGRRRPGR
jgi:hypothetical protein